MNVKKFSLVELIISVIVIALLALIVFVNVVDLKERSTETAKAATERELQVVVDRYYLDHGLYPTTPQPAKDNPQYLEVEKVLPKYIKKKPKDDYLIEVDENGKVTIIDKGSKPPYVQLTCAEAEKEGYTCIHNAEELNDVRNNMEGKYILVNDIDISNYSNWKPIGDGGNPFKGILNGNKYTISNLTINEVFTATPPSEPYTFRYGLFGVMAYGKIEHLSMTGIDIQISDEVGSNPNYFYAGKLVGYIENTETNNPLNKNVTIEDVSLTGNVKNSTTSEYSSVAGFVGGIEMNTGDLIIQDIQTTGDIAGDDEAYGFAERIFTRNGNMTLMDITITGNVNATGYIAGGFAKQISNYKETTIKNIKVTGSVIGGEQAYGFATIIENSEGTNMIVENITTKVTVSSSDDSSGFAGTIQNDEGGNMTVSGINIDADAQSIEYVYGFADMVRNYHGGTLVVKDIAIKGKMYASRTDKYSIIFGFASVVENYNSNNMTVDNVKIEASIDSTGYGTGFSSRISNYQSKNLIVKNISVKGNISTVDAEAVGFSTRIYNNHGENITIERISIISAISSIRSIAVGFVNEIANYSSTDLIIRDVNIKGSVNSAGNNADSIWSSYASGFSYDISNDYSNDLIIEGIVLELDVSAREKAFGFSYELESNYANNMKIKSVKINGDITSSHAETYGLSESIEAYSGSDAGPTTNIEDILINGTQHSPLTAYAFADVIRNSSTGMTTFKDVHIKKQITSLTEEVIGFAKVLMADRQDILSERIMLDLESNAQESSNLFIAKIATSSGINATFKDIHILGKANISNGQEGKLGGLIGEAGWYSNDGQVVFENTSITTSISVINENVALYKKGIITDMDTPSSQFIFNNVYWDKDSTGFNELNNPFGSGMSTSQMKEKSSYQGFDFDKVWKLDSNGYATLK